MNKYKRLAKNTGVFFIGNFGSKVLSFLLVRFYTECLTKSQYGTIDVITSTLGFVVPIITLCITEAALRFSIDGIEKRDKILTVAKSVIISGNIIFLFSIPVLINFNEFRDYLLFFYLLTLTNSMYQMFAHYTKGCGDSKTFAFSGFLHTFIQITFNIVLLLLLRLGIAGYLLASITANVTCIMFLIIKRKLIKPLLVFNIDKALLKEMLKYSIPLIPNTIFWWIMASSDRYVILWMLGTEDNGLYTVANKIPNIITSLSSIFFGAWQLASVEEGKSKDKNKFYSNTLQFVSLMLLVAISFIDVTIRPLFSVWVEKSYFIAWECTPLLILASFFSCLSNYLGTNYTVMKKTKGVFLTTVVGACINVFLNLLLTRLLGIKGTAFATVVSFAITWIIRAIDTRKFVKIKYDFMLFCMPLLIVCVQTIVLSIGQYNFGVQTTCFILIMIISFKYLKNNAAKILRATKNK